MKIEFDNGDEYDCESGYDFAVGGLLRNKYIYILDSHDIVHPWTDSDREFHNEFSDDEDEGPCPNDLIDCHFLGKQMNSMVLESRKNASSVVLNDTTIWITGGHASRNDDYEFEDIEDRFTSAKSTTQFIIYGEPSVQGPELPFKIFGHTMVKVNKTVYIIGGFSDPDPTLMAWVQNCDQSWVVDLINFDIVPGPSLNEGRSEHSSSTMLINGKLFIVVAGGRIASDYGRHGKNYQLNSVELLDTEYPHKGWIMGDYYIQLPELNY